MTADVRVAGLLLAAGAGRRIGGPKGLLRHPDGAPWVARSVQVLADGGCDPVVVVLGAQAKALAALLPGDLDGVAVRVVEAADWAEGMGASLRAGLAALTVTADDRAAGDRATDDRADGDRAPDDRAADDRAADRATHPVAVVVGLVDTPGVTADVVARLVAIASPSALARAAYGGAPGHPVLLGREHWAAAAASARGDAGARDYLATRDVVLVECGDVGHGTDVDTPADLQAGDLDAVDLDAVDLRAAGAPAGAYAGSVTTTRPDPLVEAHPALAPGHDHAERVHDSARLRAPARRVVRAALTGAALDVAEHEAAVADPGAGAVVSFAGVVRDHDSGRVVTGIEYVAHPSAGDVLARVVAEVAARTGVEAIAVSHRVGPLAVGDAALVVAVAGVHRQEAFAAAALLVDEVKHQLPVWKRQQFADGTDEWVACP